MDIYFLRQLSCIAQEAGAAIMDVYRHDFTSWSKADASPLTEADLRADAVIRAGLNRLFPDIPILSEESTHSISTVVEDFFLVDPLDGTKEFIKRNGEFTVNIALIRNGRPIAGVVEVPALGIQYLAAQGWGALRRDSAGETRLETCVRRPDQPLRVIGSRSHLTPATETWLQQLGEPYEFLTAGSSLKFCRLAEGAADVYPRFGPTSQWDTAAGQCILESLGGMVTDLDGVPLQYGLDRPILNPPFLACAFGDQCFFANKIVKD